MTSSRSEEAASSCTRLTLLEHTKRLLWAESGGYCQNPSCGAYLFEEERDAGGAERRVRLDWAEMAHIVAATSGGPRDQEENESLSAEDRAHHTNIAMLCANCHTMVDKAPDRFPAPVIRAWKTSHQDRLASALGTPTFSNRAEARHYIEPLLEENATIFALYGPDPEDYSLERAAQWQRLVQTKVVPNNRKILRALTNSRSLLTPSERNTSDQFGIHVDQLVDRHLLDIHTGRSIRFPQAMTDMLKDEL